MKLINMLFPGLTHSRAATQYTVGCRKACVLHFQVELPLSLKDVTSGKRGVSSSRIQLQALGSGLLMWWISKNFCGSLKLVKLPHWYVAEVAVPVVSAITAGSIQVSLLFSFCILVSWTSWRMASVIQLVYNFWFLFSFFFFFCF